MSYTQTAGNYWTDPVDFLPAETAATLQSAQMAGTRLGIVAFHVGVWRLRTIARVEEKPQRPRPKYCRHVAMLTQPGCGGQRAHDKPGA